MSMSIFKILEEEGIKNFTSEIFAEDVADRVISCLSLVAHRLRKQKKDLDDVLDESDDIDGILVTFEDRIKERLKGSHQAVVIDLLCALEETETEWLGTAHERKQ